MHIRDAWRSQPIQSSPVQPDLHSQPTTNPRQSNQQATRQTARHHLCPPQSSVYGHHPSYRKTGINPAKETVAATIITTLCCSAVLSARPGGEEVKKKHSPQSLDVVVFFLFLFFPTTHAAISGCLCGESAMGDAIGLVAAASAAVELSKRF